MAKISKETKEMNKVWTQKQQELGKNYSSYILGGLVVAVALVGSLFVIANL